MSYMDPTAAVFSSETSVLAELMISLPRVVVVAGSIEGIDALARLIHQLPSTFPIPVVAHLHGMKTRSMERLTGSTWHSASRLDIVHARDGDRIQAGHVYVIPANESLIFTAIDVLGLSADGKKSSADHLFESAATWYQSEVIGIVLSGLGTDGTQGLRAITEANGTRVVQSPNEAVFFSMPMRALQGDSVQYSVVLDRLGDLIMHLVTGSGPAETMSPEMDAEVARQTSMSEKNRERSLDRSIVDILSVMREELAVNIVFIPREMADEVVVDHLASMGDDGFFQWRSHPGIQRLCQRALDGSLFTGMSDVSNVPAMAVIPDIHIAVPVKLQSGSVFGILCCLSMPTLPDVQNRHYRRLKISARQIARIVDEPKDR